MEKLVINDRHVYKSGNSIAVSIPPIFADKMNITENDNIDILYTDEPFKQIVIVKAKK